MAESPDRRPREPERDERTGRSAAAARIQHQTHWVEQQIRVAQERGAFDDLPGAGKPLTGLGTEHDPDWWLKKLVEREQVTDFNAAVRRAIYTPPVGNQPAFPVVTRQRDVEAEVVRWRARREARRAAQRALLAEQEAATPPAPHRWWRRR